MLGFAAGVLDFAELAAAVGGWVGVSARAPLHAVAASASITANRTPLIELIGHLLTWSLHGAYRAAVECSTLCLDWSSHGPAHATQAAGHSLNGKGSTSLAKVRNSMICRA